MVSVIYVSLCALIIVRLAWNVIKLRRSKRVSLGDGGDKDLAKAIGAQENATEYMPITLLMLLGLELNGAPLILVHVIGSLFVLARLMHAYGIVKHFRWRIQGMWLTAFCMVSLVVANFVYLPYTKLL